jgi:uncharacterized lipoprotein NlpE involved in copper resistance
MKKKIFLIAAIAVLIIIGCANGSEEKALDQKTIVTGAQNAGNGKNEP